MKQLVKHLLVCGLLLAASSTFAQVAYDITWYYANVQYRALLVPQNGDWWCRVRYVAYGRVNFVDQTMTPTQYSDGVALHGCCPVYGGTYVRHSTYQADNFLIFYDGRMFNVDNMKQRSHLSAINRVYSTQSYYRLLNTVFRV